MLEHLTAPIQRASKNAVVNLFQCEGIGDYAPAVTNFATQEEGLSVHFGRGLGLGVAAPCLVDGKRSGLVAAGLEHDSDLLCALIRLCGGGISSVQAAG